MDSTFCGRLLLQFHKEQEHRKVVYIIDRQDREKAELF